MTHKKQKAGSEAIICRSMARTPGDAEHKEKGNERPCSTVKFILLILLG